MTIEAEIAGLVASTDALLEAVQVSKASLDDKVDAAALSASSALATKEDIEANWQDKLAAASGHALDAGQSAAQALEQSLVAVAAGAQAQVALSAAQLSSGVYADTATGLSQTTSGRYFSVPSAVASEYLILYKNNAGAALEVKRYPAAGFRKFMGVALPATTPSASLNDYYMASVPGAYAGFGGVVVANELASLVLTAGGWVKETLYNFDSQLVSAGEVVNGAIYPVLGNALTGTVTVKVAPNTRVRVNRGIGTAEIAIPVQALSLTTASHNAASCRLYCSTAGTLYATTSASMPAGEWILLATKMAGQGDTGANGNRFPFAPAIPSNHFFWGPTTSLNVTPSAIRTINFVSLGGVGDGVTDNAEISVLLAYLLAYFTQVDNYHLSRNYYGAPLAPIAVYFPAGTYAFSNSPNFAGMRIVGAGKGVTIITATTHSLMWVGVREVEDLTFNNCILTTGTLPVEFKMSRVVLYYDSDLTVGSTYCVYAYTQYTRVVDCDFDFMGRVYIPLYIYNYIGVVVERCTFNRGGTGYASHNVRFASPYALKSSVVIRHCLVVGGTTGIFFGSSRSLPVSNCLVEFNELRAQIEESISFDGFGNNAGLCPVVCNGQITAASNDADGRLVITANMLYHDGTTPNVPSNVSLRSDWTGFWFSIDEDSGRAGTITRIIAASGDNTYTLESYSLASEINIGGWCGVQSGFFDCAVRNNVISGSVGATRNYGTGMSIYLNVFNFDISGNTVSNCNSAIQVVGGLMLGTYRTLAYNNVVHGNKILNCGQVAPGAVVTFSSLYSAAFHQYGNQFTNNVVVGGAQVVMNSQRNLVFNNNQMDVASVAWSRCGNTLPPPGSAQVGRTFMLITDDVSGNPVTIEYYVCKLAGGVYSWSPV